MGAGEAAEGLRIGGEFSEDRPRGRVGGRAGGCVVGRGGEQDMRGGVERGRAEGVRVAVVGGADGGLRGRLGRDPRLDQRADHRLVLGLAPAAAKVARQGGEADALRLLPQEGAHGEGARRRPPGEAGLARGRRVELRLRGDRRRRDHLSVDHDVGLKGELHRRHPAGCWFGGIARRRVRTT